MNFLETDIEILRSKLTHHETTTRAVVETSLDAAEKLNDTLNAFLQIDRAGALRRADEIDAGGDSKQTLAGIPIAIKDNICVRGLQTSCGSRILGPYQAPYNATAIERLNAAGAVIIGKTNCDEFAMGSSNENSAFGPVRNPWDTERVPGGSSGGSAAAVASRIVPAALGSETGGSVRQPAALCGVVGVKPTYGRVSRSGLVAFASGLDQIGTLTKTVAEAAELLGIIAGHDPLDSTSSAEPVDDYSADVERGVKGLRFGVVREAVEKLEGDVRVNFDDALRVLRKGGAIVEDASVPAIVHAIA